MEGFRKACVVIGALLASALVSCGHSSDVLPSSVDAPPASASVATSSDVDPNSSLGKALVQIDSPTYQNQLVFSLSDYSAVQELQKKYPEITFKPKFGDPKKVDREQRRLERVTGKKLPDLRRHIVVDSSDKTKAKDILKKIWDERGMEAFRPRMKAQLNGINSVPDLTGQQGYLNDLSIPAVWARGVTGQGTHISDQESDWNPDHEDLPRYPGISSTNTGLPGFIAHGTAILGILIAKDNAHGIKGIAYGAEAGSVVGDVTTPAVLANGSEVAWLRSGIVFLDEQGYLRPGANPNHCQGGNAEDCVPSEYYPDGFEANQISTAFGVPVVLPSGNSSINMDTTPNVEGWPDLRFRREDSGAIIVGASTGASHQKTDWSNCGQRVDLFSWGQGVVTTSYPAGDGFEWTGAGNPNSNGTNAYFTNQFGGTSSAGAIIAGSIALLQSYAVQQMGSAYKQLTPLKLREILVNSGIPAQNEQGCSIGKQPRMDVAMQLFDDLWTEVQRDFPEIHNQQEISGSRRQTLRDRGIQLLCNYHRPDLSDVNCPETAKCVLLPSSVERVRGHPENPNACQGAGFPACIDIDYAQSDYDCAAGAIWPKGVTIAKPLDFDGDGKADLVSWTKNGWKVDLSSRNGLGAWDLQFNIPMTMGRWVWPVAEDYNSDGRTDFAVWDKEHGIWYIAFTNDDLLSGHWHGWDWQVTLPYHDELNRNVWLTKYGRPVPGDYDGNGYTDLAIARSDGIWSIDFGGPNRSNYGSFDQNTQFLTAQQLSQAPGWAYLPVYGSGYIEYKIPDSLPNAGSDVVVFSDGSNGQIIPAVLGGNEAIPMMGGYRGYSYGTKRSNGRWELARAELNPSNEIIWRVETPSPNGIFGGLECHPFLADCDNDNVDDLAVQCPNEFRIVLSNTAEVIHIPLGYNTNEFTLPGKPYFGGISYVDVQRIIQQQLNASGAPPIIPVDMVQTQLQP